MEYGKHSWTGLDELPIFDFHKAAIDAAVLKLNEEILKAAPRFMGMPMIFAKTITEDGVAIVSKIDEGTPDECWEIVTYHPKQGFQHHTMSPLELTYAKFIG